MADPKWRFEIFLSILMKFSNGAVFRSLIIHLVLFFQKKKKNSGSKMVIIIPITFRVSVKLGLMSLKNCNLVR
jgi:hypothetical protein